MHSCEFEKTPYLCATSLSKKNKEGTESPLFVCVDFMEIAAHIQKIADDLLANGPHFVLDLRVNARLKTPRITLTVDGENGITIDDCANISRALSEVLNKENLLEDYHLEVTTPGIDQPLKLPRQYKKHIGRNVKVELTLEAAAQFDDQQTLRGKLVETTENGLALELEKKDKKALPSIKNVTFDQINKTFVMVSFK